MGSTIDVYNLYSSILESFEIIAMQSEMGFARLEEEFTKIIELDKEKNSFLYIVIKEWQRQRMSIRTKPFDMEDVLCILESND